jgi:steroid 5-alpha reductase family enzyme
MSLTLTLNCALCHADVAIALLPVLGVFAGVLLESVADYQKNSYRNNKRNDGHWCDVGLWKLSRYPNCKPLSVRFRRHHSALKMNHPMY